MDRRAWQAIVHGVAIWHDWATEQAGMLVLSLFFEKIPSCFFHNDCTDLHFYQQCTRVLFFPSSCQHLLFVFFFIIVILMDASWYLLWFSFAFPWWLVMSIFSCAWKHEHLFNLHFHFRKNVYSILFSTELFFDIKLYKLFMYFEY